MSYRSRPATVVVLVAALAGVGCGGGGKNNPGTGGTSGSGGASDTGGTSGTGGASGDAGMGTLGIFGSDSMGMFALTESVTATHAASSITIMASAAPRAMTLSLTGPGAIAPGLIECATGAASVAYQPMPGVAYLADMTHGSCLIELRSVGKKPGDVTEGTFSATVIPAADGDNITIFDARFQAPVQ